MSTDWNTYSSVNIYYGEMAFVKDRLYKCFLQTGAANRDVYVVPRRECRRKSFHCLLFMCIWSC